MKEDELLNITSSIENKLGKESTATISDDIGVLITKNTEVLQSLKDKDDEIQRLRDTNAKLVSANGNLLRSIPMGTAKASEPEPKEEHKSFNIRSCFDSKGNFIM